MTAGGDNEDDDERIGSDRDDDGVGEMNGGKVRDWIVGDGDEETVGDGGE